MDKKYNYEELLDIIHALRSENGCPWDKAQTHETLIPCLREESEEVVQAIENQDMDNLCEELGDVLLQVLLHAEIASETGAFTMEDVIQGLAEKMVRRHPHVFGDVKVNTPEEGLALWNSIKMEEKRQKNLDFS